MSELNEEPANRAERYIGTLETAVKRQQIKQQNQPIRLENVEKVWGTIRRYINDARYYLDIGKPTTSLACVAYAEGLLDALAFLELTESTT